MASLLLPASIREAACSLYAFCRVADDVIDEGSGDAAAVYGLRRRVARACAGRPDDTAVDRALADVVADYGIPQTLLDALIDGFAWDAEQRRYADLRGVEDYGARVAGTVGAMMALLMGERRPEVVARACDLGVAMQLSNIARDVGEDARRGRVYLPLDWLDEAGVDVARFIAKPAFDERLGEVVRRLLRAADELYARAELGIAQLPASCRPAIFAARLLYAEIGLTVERRGLDSVSSRAVVPTGRKLRLLADAFARSGRPVRWQVLPPLPATAYLVDAVARAPAGRLAGVTIRPAWWDIDARAGRMIELMAEAEVRAGLSAGRPA